ncbi:hypothetical protein [Roseibacillus ishigakijimensis]|uniref:Uncharacterized protein n=1 Tax=Roseibacillus ishigakijimensis TaxID=454146 RepID=A0A934RNB1_9BACT|nr:hypothetical protein [Roseibacillus ishigakijimensis]MBK1834952.1 hypothetical protein [Roseibacillus ishigakijimensis]
MNRWFLIAKVSAGLLVLWLGIFWVRTLLAPHIPSAERVAELVEKSDLTTASPQERQKSLQQIAEVVNGLDLDAQEKARATLEAFFTQLNGAEREQFVALTAESFTRFFEALDSLTPQARREFIERGFRELQKDDAGGRLERLLARDPEIMQRITEEGMRAYFQDASPETKMSLAPFLKATSEVMEGTRAQPFGGNRP